MYAMSEEEVDRESLRHVRNWEIPGLLFVVFALAPVFGAGFAVAAIAAFEFAHQFFMWQSGLSPPEAFRASLGPVQK